MKKITFYNYSHLTIKTMKQYLKNRLKELKLQELKNNIKAKDSFKKYEIHVRINEVKKALTRLKILALKNILTIEK